MTLSLPDLLSRLDDRLLDQAFTHSSLAADRARSYERLEFLGDSVLSLCVTAELYRRYPQYPEGHLARLRAYIVSRETCAKVATELGLGRELARRAPAHHDAEEVRQLAANANVLADLTEAVIGAAFLTFGFETVRPAVIEAFKDHILFAERSHVDNKTQLQELLAKSARTVVYRTVGQTGPAHDRHFEVEAVVGHEVYGRGHGPSKKRAEQMAAGEALEELRRRERPPQERKVRLLARRRRSGPAAEDCTGGAGSLQAAPAAADTPTPKARLAESGRSATVPVAAEASTDAAAAGPRRKRPRRSAAGG